MLIENQIAEAIQFFPKAALSSVPLKVDVDLRVTLITSTLYRMLAAPDRSRLERPLARTTL